MAQQEQTRSGGGFSRFLFQSIIILSSLLGGVFLGFYFGHMVPGQKAAPAGAAEGGAAEGGGGGGGAVHDSCTVHLRSTEGVLRSDLTKVALLDGAGKQVLEPELIHGTTIRIACPQEALATELVARTSGGELFDVAEVSLDAARGYVEVDLPAEAADAEAVAARWSELGLGDAPGWLTEEPGTDDGGGEDAGGEDSGGQDAGPSPDPGIDLGEPRDTEGDLYVEIRDLVGESRDKPDIRQVIKDNGYQIEACIQQKGDGIERARHTTYVGIASNGRITMAEQLQGEAAELDACVAGILGGWDFGPADGSVFFQLKTVWTP